MVYFIKRSMRNGAIFIFLNTIIMNPEDINMEPIFESAKQLKSELISIRRTLHQYPEIGSLLPKTQSFVFNKLKEYGY